MSSGFNATFKLSRLKYGHVNAVNCLHFSHIIPILLASGSEDASCRIWDIRVKRSVRRLTVPNHAPISSLLFDCVSEYEFYASALNEVYDFDLRRPEILLDRTNGAFRVENGAEINQIAQSYDGRSLAASDDEGRINIFDLSGEKEALHWKPHENICSTVQYQTSSSCNIISGGMDSTIAYWNLEEDITSPRIVVVGLAADDSMGCSSQGPSQSFNPPLVHSVTCSHDGRLVAVAVGDSTIALYKYGASKSLKRFVAHNAPVAQVVFNSSCIDQQGGVYDLISISSDRCMKGWRIDIPIHEELLELPNSTACEARCLFTLILEEKPNWIDIQNGHIAIADTSEIVKLYKPK